MVSSANKVKERMGREGKREREEMVRERERGKIGQKRERDREVTEIVTT